MAEPSKWNWWSILKIIVLPVALALISYFVSNAIQESANRVKYIELAIGILQTAPSADTENIRIWAIRVMDKYSEVPINEEMKRELKTKKIPVSDTLSLRESLTTELKRGEKESK